MSALLWRHKLAVSIPVDYDLAKLPYPVLCSPKLDGVRAGVQRGTVVSRNGRAIANLQVQAVFGKRKYEGLDGEIVAGKPCGEGVFNRTVRVTQKRDADASDAAFYAFDFASGYEDTFQQRLKILQDSFKGSERATRVHVVKRTLVRDAGQLLSYEATQLELGYEGVMLVQAASGAYPCKPGKVNRSTLAEFTLVRLKRFEHDFARVLAVHPLVHNKNEGRVAGDRRSTRKVGMVEDALLMGSVNVERLDGKSGFSITLGSKELRAWPGWRDPARWKGKKIRFKYFPVGSMNGVPRFPTADFKELL